MLHAIDSAVAYGESKRSYMHGHAGDTGYKIYSYNYRQDLDTLARSLGAYIKAAYPGCKMVRDIRPEMLQGYLDDKAYTSGATVQKVVSHLHKLDAVCQHRYGGDGWHSDQMTAPETVQDDKQRDHVATDAEYKALYADMRAHKSEAWKALPLSRYAGLRVSECAAVKVGRLDPTGGRYGCGTLTLQGKEDGTKGGRWRTVDIMSLEGRKALQEAFDGHKDGDYAIRQKNGQRLQSDSINTQLKRSVIRCGLDVQAWRQCGCHALRKAFAQECYDAVRSAGGSKKEAIAYANKQLGHGRQRRDETKAYISNLW